MHVEGYNIVLRVIFIRHWAYLLALGNLLPHWIPARLVRFIDKGTFKHRYAWWRISVLLVITVISWPAQPLPLLLLLYNLLLLLICAILFAVYYFMFQFLFIWGYALVVQLKFGSYMVHGFSLCSFAFLSSWLTLFDYYHICGFTCI